MDALILPEEGEFQMAVFFYAGYFKQVELQKYETTAPQLKTADVVTAALNQVMPENIVFDRVHFGSGYVSDSGKTLNREDRAGNSLATLNLTIRQPGLYEISFLMEEDDGASTCLGVALADSSEYPLENYRPSGGYTPNVHDNPGLCCIRSFLGTVYKKGGKLSQTVPEFYLAGSVVRMIVEANNHQYASIYFLFNSENRTLVFEQLPLPLTPMVAFYAAKPKRVTIMNWEYSSPGLIAAPGVTISPDPSEFTRRVELIRFHPGDSSPCSTCQSYSFSVHLECGHTCCACMYKKDSPACPECELDMQPIQNYF